MIKAGDEDGQVCETTRLSEDGDGWRHEMDVISEEEKEKVRVSGKSVSWMQTHCWSFRLVIMED